MITIQQSSVVPPYDDAALKADAQAILDILGYSDFDLGILLTDNKTIQEYNRAYRHKDKPTDILSFAYHHDLKAGDPIIIHDPEDKNLGDLIISLEYVRQDAPQWEQTFEQRMRVLLVHGICHLRGYDHIEDEDYIVMYKEEDRLLSLLAL
jgi:probable rRNA maturation factor